MNSTNGALDFDVVVRDRDSKKVFDNLERQVLGLTQSADKGISSLDATFSRLGQVAAGAFAFTELVSLPGQIVKVRGEFQQLEIALNTMLGSKAKGDKLLGEIVTTAATTPFGLKDLASATKQLLAYGSASESVIGEIRMLGDVASGVSVPIGDLVYLYGTLRSQGRAYAVDIRQFAGRGIPIYAELAKVLGVGVGEVNNLVEAGKVGFPQVEQAFRNMTATGGMFGGLMDAQSKSLTGLIERLKDGIDVAYNEIGKANEGLAADVITGATVAVENYQRIGDILTILIATYGAYKAAVIAVNATNMASSSSSLIAEANALAQSLTVTQQAGIAKQGLVKGSLEYANAVKTSVTATLSENEAKITQLALEVNQASQKRKLAAESLLAAQARTVALREELATVTASAGAEISAAKTKRIASIQKKLDTSITNENTLAQASNNAVKDLGAKRGALMTLSVQTETLAKNVSTAAEVRYTAAQSLRMQLTRQMIALQTAFNATLLANPIVATTVALVALAGAVWYLSDSTTAAELAQKSINQTLEEQKKKKEDLISKTSQLTSVVNSETATAFAQLQAYNALKALYPILLQNIDLHKFKLMGVTEQQKLLNAAMDQMGIANTSSAFDAANKKVDELSKKLDVLRKQQASGIGAGSLAMPIAETQKALEAARIEAEKLGGQVKQNTADSWESNTPVEEKIKHYEKLQSDLLNQRKGIEDNINGLKKAGAAASDLNVFFATMSLTGLNQQLDQVGGKLLAMQGKPNALFGGNKGYWEKLKTDANEKRDALGISQVGSTEWKQLTKEIDEADKKLQAYSATKKKAEKKVPERDKPQPFGSLAYYEQIARKADEVISKTPGTKTDVLAKQNQIKIDAEKKAEEIRKSLAVKSFEEELEEKKKVYELYQRWIDAYGQKSADEQFKSLISSNKNYVAYLDQEIQKLQSIQNFTPLNKTDTERLLNLQSERTEAIGGPSKVDQYRESLEAAKNEAASLTEYIGFLKQAQDSLNSAAPTSDVIDQRKITIDAKIEAEKQRKQLLSEFLLNTEESEEKRLEIENHYAELRNALEERSQGEKTEAYQKAMDLINRKESEELQERKIRIREASQEYKALIKAVENAGTSSGLFDQINRQKDLVANLIASEGYSDAAMQEQRKLADMQRAMYMQIAGAVGELGDALQNVGGIVGNIGQALSGIASQGNNLVTVFDKNASASQKWGAAVQSVSNLIGIIANSARQRKEAETAYYNSVIGQQSQYNILLNDAIGMQSEMNGSVFITDYAGKMTDGIRMMADAQAGYQKSLQALEEGRAKIGQRDKVDWGKVGSGAASGAVLGAAIGSAIPVIGNIVGGVVGGLVGGIAGLFGGKKKKDQYGGLLEVFPELIDQAGNFNKVLADTLIANNLVDDTTKMLLQDTIAWTEQLEKAKEQIESVITELAGGLGDGIRSELVGAFEDGTSAAEAWGAGVSRILKDLISQTLFSQLFAADFKKLQAEMEASYGLQGDQNFVDDIVRFYETAGSKAQTYLDALAAAQAEGEKYGLDLFNKTAGKKTDPLSGSIQGMSQETASVLAGQFNAIRITNADISASMRQMLIYQANISRNSDLLRYMPMMEEMVYEMKKWNGNSMRWWG
jgi:hypothetical protein